MAYTNKQRIVDYRATFSTEHGKRVLADLCHVNYVLTGTLDLNEHVTCFNEGRRNAVLDILKWLQTKPSAVRDLVEDIDDRLGFSANEAGIP